MSLAHIAKTDSPKRAYITEIEPEVLDLLGMCAKGSNKVTEDYARSMFDARDIMTALTERPPADVWGRAMSNPLTGSSKHLPQERSQYANLEERWLPVLIRSPFVRMLHGIFFGEGDAGSKGGPPGDLYVFLSVRPDPRFRREGMEIYSEVSVSYVDAILGSTLRVPTVNQNPHIRRNP